MINETSGDTTNDTEEALAAEELAAIKKKSVSGVFSYFGRTAFLQAIGLAAQIVLTAVFTPEDFGVYGIVVQIVGILVFFSDVGLAAALVQKKEEPTLEDYRTAFTVQQILSWVIMGIVLVVLSTGFVQAKTGMAGVWVLLSLAISFPLATLKTIPSIMLERKLDFSKLVLPQVFEQIVFYGILVFLALQHMGAMSYAYAILARSVIGVLVMWVIQPWSYGFSLNKHSLKTLLSYGTKFQLNDFLARIKDQLFYLFLGLMLPLREFGYIQWAKTWSQYPYNLTVQNVMAITFPTFSRLQGHKEALQRAIEKSLFFITLSIFPLLIGMSVFIGPLTQVFEQYSKWQPAVLSFMLFTLSIGWAAISTPMVNTLNAVGHINKSLKLMVMWTSLTWILTPLAIKLYGFNGVAISGLIISFTSFIPVLLVKKIVPIRVWDNVWRQLVAASVMAGLGVMGISIWQQSAQWLMIGMVAATFAYALTMVVIGWNKVAVELQSLRK
jgi:O-antigen/teichoic acid export membrane protein